MPASTDRYFLGGRDLEMREIRILLEEVGLGDRIVDQGLAWGARASAYGQQIRTALGSGETPVLIELVDDLSDIDRQALVIVDHHGARAGADRPSALRQIFNRAAKARGAAWTRRRHLVEANDIGHIAGLRAAGATSSEIRAIRDADRASQGIDAATEAESRRAVANLTRQGGLSIVCTTGETSSAIADFATTDYGGPGADDLLVIGPAKLSFYGNGAAVLALARVFPASWSGGALPHRGYWGIGAAGEETCAVVVAAIRKVLGAASR